MLHANGTSTPPRSRDLGTDLPPWRAPLSLGSSHDQSGPSHPCTQRPVWSVCVCGGGVGINHACTANIAVEF